MENKPVNILEKILYGQKVTNDNVVALNEKIDAVIRLLTFEDTEHASSTDNKEKEAQ